MAGTKKPVRLLFAWLKCPNASPIPGCELAFAPRACKIPYNVCFAQPPLAFMDSDTSGLWTQHEFARQLLRMSARADWKFSIMGYEQPSTSTLVVSGTTATLASSASSSKAKSAQVQPAASKDMDRDLDFDFFSSPLLLSEKQAAKIQLNPGGQNEESQQENPPDEDDAASMDDDFMDDDVDLHAALRSSPEPSDDEAAAARPGEGSSSCRHSSQAT